MLTYECCTLNLKSRVTFVGVIEHDIENDFDASLVERLDHIAEFPYMVTGFRTDAITRVWGKIAHGAIAPVIAERLTLELPGFGVIEFENRQ